MAERDRKIFHVVFGALLIAAGILFGKTLVAGGLMALLFFGLLLLQLKLSRLRMPLVDRALKRFDRPSLMPGYGALTFVVSALLMFTFIPFQSALGFMAILAFGDGFASFVGRNGAIKLPWNRQKSLEGLVTFFLAGSAFSVYFLGVSALGFALVLALLESFDLPFDDNLCIGAGSVVLSRLFA